MHYYSYIIRLLVIGDSLFIVGQCGDNKNDKEAFKFEVELINNIWTTTDREYELRHRKGPKLTWNLEFRERLCVSAMNHISFAFKDPITPEMGLYSIPWGRCSYPDKEECDHHFNHLRCGTSPRTIYIRAVDDAANKFIIMVEGFQKSADGFYGMSPREYRFDSTIIGFDPVRSVDETDNLLSMIGNQDLRKVYEEMYFMDWMLVCLKSKDYIMEHNANERPITHPSSIGYRLLKFDSVKTGRKEEFVAYQCPVRPLLYAYLEDSTTVGIAFVLEQYPDDQLKDQTAARSLRTPRTSHPSTSTKNVEEMLNTLSQILL